jgi:hypothetical protein
LTKLRFGLFSLRLSHNHGEESRLRLVPDKILTPVKQVHDGESGIATQLAATKTAAAPAFSPALATAAAEQGFDCRALGR